ncbi:unnamed protein product [Ambrosiozyma monospora]|uniref:Unnamed protein product n=1 Tax=Ambrosiozyma monospora TaxID=43982 RepID=A0ACB5T6B7_AMBMO|nr:unnamed protein product [Ambrosiozyma monospora]
MDAVRTNLHSAGLQHLQSLDCGMSPPRQPLTQKTASNEINGGDNGLVPGYDNSSNDMIVAVGGDDTSTGKLVKVRHY